jgi:hypothetical protein
MFTHPDLMSIVAKQHLKELAEEASKHRLAAELRRGRRQRWPARGRKADPSAQSHAATVNAKPAAKPAVNARPAPGGAAALDGKGASQTRDEGLVGGRR